MPIENHLITGPETKQAQEPDKISETIAEAENLEIHYDSDWEQTSYRIISQKLKLSLPDKFHFSSVIYEMQKQYFHSKNWFDSKIEARREQCGFRFKKWKSQLHSDLELMAKQKMQQDLEQMKSQKSL